MSCVLWVLYEIAIFCPSSSSFPGGKQASAWLDNKLPPPRQYRLRMEQPGHLGQISKRVRRAVIWRGSDSPLLLLSLSLVPRSDAFFPPLPPSHPPNLNTCHRAVSCLLSWRRKTSQGTEGKRRGGARKEWKKNEWKKERRRKNKERKTERKAGEAGKKREMANREVSARLVSWSETTEGIHFCEL